MKKLFLFLFLSTFLIGFASSQTMYYTFNNTLNDSSGNNLNLNGTGFFEKGILNTSLRVNTTFTAGVNNESLNWGTGDFTIAFWVNYSNPNQTGIIGTNDVLGPDTGTFSIRVNRAGRLGGVTFLASNPTFEFHSRNRSLNDSNWHFIAYTRSSNNFTIYVNGIVDNSTTITNTLNETRFGLRVGEITPFEGLLDELRLYKGTALSASEINTLYNLSSLGFVQVNLNSPLNNQVFSTSSITFNSSANIINPINNFTNATFWIWHQNGTLFNKTTNVATGNITNSTTLNIINFINGQYLWNAQWCGQGFNCTFAPNNFSFEIGASIISEIFNVNTYETATENFQISINLLSGIELSLAQLVYNGTNYTVSDITISNNTRTLRRTIDIPVIGSLQNTTKNFFWRFTFSNSQQTIQETPEQIQNVGFINFQRCDSTYTIQALNFTLYDEFNQTNLQVNANTTSSFESSWNYWVGQGTTYKNYSFQLLINATTNNYRFCIFPYNPNYNFTVNGDIDYSANNYRENQYHLRSAILNNVSNNILLYLLHQDVATKFFITFTQGTQAIVDATVTVQKFFTGLGQFITTSILLTDDDGETTMWQELDKDYKYFIVQNGTLLGVVEKTSICSTAPCTIFISIDTTSSDPFSSFYEQFARNIVSSLTFNKTTKIVTYEFLDTTGLANYFRLEVSKSQFNQTGEVICNSQLFSPSGTLTCNMTNYSGEFIAKGFISRSPELTDKVFNFITDDDFIEGLGITGVFLILVLIIVIVFAGAVTTKGSPSGILFFLGIGILLLKIGNLFPFTWTTVVVIEFLIGFILWKVKQ